MPYGCVTSFEYSFKQSKIERYQGYLCIVYYQIIVETIYYFRINLTVFTSLSIENIHRWDTFNGKLRRITLKRRKHK